MLKIARIMESLGTDGERRAVALEVWRSFGGPLEDLKRVIERERKAVARDRRECPDDVPLLSLESPEDVRESQGQNVAITPSPHTPLPPTQRVFEVPESIRMALRKCSFLGTKAILWKPSFWQSAIRANPGLDYARVVLAAEAYVQAKPAARPRKRFGTFMLHQLERAAERAE